jgi:hypothetical protein
MSVCAHYLTTDADSILLSFETVTTYIPFGSDAAGMVRAPLAGNARDA